MRLFPVPIGIGMGACGGACYRELPRIPLMRTSSTEIPLIGLLRTSEKPKIAKFDNCFTYSQSSGCHWYYSPSAEVYEDGGEG
jgi:hypothetical protein